MNPSMPGEKRNITIIVIVLVIALIFNHVNFTAMILGENWSDFCIARSFKRNHIEFMGKIWGDGELEAGIDIMGEMDQHILTLRLLQNYFELLSVSIDMEEETISLESLLGSLEPMGYEALDLVEIDLMTSLTHEIEISCVNRHIVEDHRIMDIYLINNQLYMAIDYTGQIQKAWGTLTDLYSFELAFNY